MEKESGKFTEKHAAEPMVLVLIDSNAIIHRAYHALPKNMSTSKGELTNAVYGYATTLVKILEDLHPTHICASFDISKSTFRLEQYAEYKATRVAADQELYDQIPKVRELLSTFNIPVYEMEGYEADDCIGTIVQKMKNIKSNKTHSTGSHSSLSLPSISTQALSLSNGRAHPSESKTGQAVEPIRQAQGRQFSNIAIYIVSGDKDLFQLIDGNIFVYWLKKGLSEAGVINRKVIEVEWNLQPEDFIDLKALAGDASDNIPGIPGIGPKTATDLLRKFDTLKKLYEEIDKLLNCYIADRNNKTIEQYNNEVLEKVAKELDLKPRILNLLLRYQDQAFLSQNLATINRNVPIDFELEKCRWGDYDKGKVRDFFEKMQFHSLLKRFGVEAASEPKTKQAKEQKEKDEQLKLL